MPKLPFFSIVIPTLNEEKYLPYLLKDLSEQTFDLSLVEVIHVDGSSPDKTVQVAKKFANKLKLTSIVVKKRNVAFQRNTGASRAKGKWIIFMDADNRLPNDFLDGIKYQLAKNPQCSVFTSLIKVESLNQADRTIETAINLGLMLLNQSKLKSALGALIGANQKVCSQTKFDTTQKIYEDSFFVQSAINKGFEFKTFKEPRYFFSLRRLKKEGVLKMARTVASLQLRYLTGQKDFSKSDAGYVMDGGGYYQTKSHHDVFYNLEKYIKLASKRQLQKAKKLLETLLLD
ncbi:MAG: glycosyltransferase family A protein, partial [Patescibacteria group bacterium]|nr:glycosyltransferase family 2 protein [Patescibacteria group bacterium]